MRWRSAIAGLVLLGAFAPAGAELSSSDFSKLRRDVRATAKKPGADAKKSKLLRSLSTDDTARAAKLLLHWIAESKKLAGKLEQKLAAKQRRLDRMKGTSHSKLIETTQAVSTLRFQSSSERRLLSSLVAKVAEFGNEDAVRHLLDESKRDVKAASDLPGFRRSVFELCRRRPAAEITPRLCAFALDEDLPDVRVWVLRWITEGRVKHGYDAALRCLGPGPPLVRREAVRAMTMFNEPKCVPALVAALPTADGIVAVEIEQALHRFTGKTFKGYGSAEMWRRWWTAEGAAWLAGDTKRRFRAQQSREKRGAEFYGIRTRSTRIVFVIDRSSSMERKIPRGGAVSGSKRDTRVPGNTRFEVAQNQLARTIRSLRPDVRFGIVFYDSDLLEWLPDRGLKPATPENKRKAVTWAMSQRTHSATLMFDALDRALRYANVTDGADTIFLLSDGHPTTDQGKVLAAEVRDAAVTRFLRRTRPFRLIVHTIGVGPGHSKRLMARLAKATGGEYRAVGMR